jgi:sec-independent protein translocase protein TatA
MGFLGDLGGWKIIILAVVALVIFGGATRLPIFAKGLGQSVRVFRKEMTGVKADIEQEKSAKPGDATATPLVEPVLVPADSSTTTAPRS